MSATISSTEAWDMFDVSSSSTTPEQHGESGSSLPERLEQCTPASPEDEEYIRLLEEQASYFESMADEQYNGFVSEVAERSNKQVQQKEEAQRTRGYIYVDTANGKRRRFIAQVPTGQPRTKTGKRSYLIAECLDAGFSGLQGPSGAFKTFTALSWAVAIAHPGIHYWFGRHVGIKGLVVLLAAEGREMTEARLIAACLRLGVDFESTRHNIRIIEGGPKLNEPDTQNERFAKVTSELHGLLGDLKEDLGEKQIALIIVDTVNRHSSGDENSAGSNGMGSFIAGCEQLRTTFDCSLLTVHHMNAAGTGARGSTAFPGALDQLIWLDRDEGDGGDFTSLEPGGISRFTLKTGDWGDARMAKRKDGAKVEIRMEAEIVDAVWADRSPVLKPKLYPPFATHLPAEPEFVQDTTVVVAHSRNASKDREDSAQAARQKEEKLTWDELKVRALDFIEKANRCGRKPTESETIRDAELGGVGRARELLTELETEELISVERIGKEPKKGTRDTRSKVLTRTQKVPGTSPGTSPAHPSGEVPEKGGVSERFSAGEASQLWSGEMSNFSEKSPEKRLLPCRETRSVPRPEKPLPTPTGEAGQGTQSEAWTGRRAA